MSRVVGVHGAFHELRGPHQLRAHWLPALQDGAWLAGHALAPEDVSFAFYGDLFRRDPSVEPAPRSVEEALDAVGLGELLDEPGPQAALDRLQKLLGDALTLRLFDTIARYVTQPDLRDRMRQRLADQVTAGTRVVVAHSLGTIVAYEALCANPHWPVRALVTLGSPLGAPLVLAALDPRPEGGRGAWPAGLDSWVNVVAVDDRAAVRPALAEVFGERVQDVVVDNGARAHAAEPYLAAAATGRAVAAALAGG